MNVSNVFFFFFLLALLSLSLLKFFPSLDHLFDRHSVVCFPSKKSSLVCTTRFESRRWKILNFIEFYSPSSLSLSLSLSVSLRMEKIIWIILLVTVIRDDYGKGSTSWIFLIFKGESDARTSFVSIFEASLYMFEKKSASWDTHTRTHTYTRTHTHKEKTGKKKKFNSMWTQ